MAEQNVDEDVLDEDDQDLDEADLDDLSDEDLDEDSIEEEDLEDEEDDDTDVEASLDVILKERMVVVEDEDEEDEDEPDTEDRSEGPMRVRPKQPGEFVCQSCFLVKHPGQLADPRGMLCRDCV